MLLKKIIYVMKADELGERKGWIWGVAYGGSSLNKFAIWSCNASNFFLIAGLLSILAWVAGEWFWPMTLN
jgi:hypothetical protein